MSSWPWSLRSLKASELSTPPERSTAIFIGFTVANKELIGKDAILSQKEKAIYNW